MTATSDFKAYIDFDHEEVDDGKPCSVSTGRILSNNAMHLADEQGQCRVNWVARSTSDYIIPDSIDEADKFYRLFSTVFPLTLDVSAASYELVVRIGAVSSSGSVDATFGAVCAATRNAAGAHVIDSSRDNVAHFTTTSSTIQWLTSQTITVPRSELAASFQVYNINDTGGVGASVNIPEVTFEVWGKTGNIASEPRLFGIKVQEYVGL